jgi:lipoprotein-releasing system permease protein
VQFIKPDVYYINYLPTEVRTADALAVALATFAICVAATLYPAWRAAQIAPVEALRYE